MSLRPGEDIGLETHHPGQFVRISQGEACLILGGKKHELKDDHAVVILTGTPHNVTNKPASEQLKLYAVYSPSDHLPNTLRVMKAEADAAEHAAQLAGYKNVVKSDMSSKVFIPALGITWLDRLPLNTCPPCLHGAPAPGQNLP